MDERLKRYRKKVKQYSMRFSLKEQKESDYFSGLGISLKNYLLSKIREDMKKDNK